MKKLLGITGLVLVFSLVVYQGRGEAKEGRERILELVDIPTAWLYSKGNYQTNLRIYDEGSLLFRLALSLTDYIMLGVPLDIRHLVGRRAMEFKLPPVVWAKICLIKKGSNFWPTAIGYDPTNYGQDDDKRVRGVYLVCTKPILLRNLPMEWHIGANADLENFDKRGICGFGGIDLSINPYLLFYSEIDGISSKGGSLLNLGIRYLSSKHLELEIGLRDVTTYSDRLISFKGSHRLF